MSINSQMTDDALLKLTGRRLAGLRLASNLTQGQLAEKAGLGLRTVQRLELGATATQLSGFIRVCRALGLVDRWELFIPEPTPGPMAQLKLQRPQRRRATGHKMTLAPAKKWIWGEAS